MDKQEMEKQRKRSIRVGVGVFAAGIALLLLIQLMLPGLVTNGSGDSYRFYAGPILPLTTLGGGQAEAARNVDFDFTPFTEPYKSSLDPRYVTITDSYTLTNSTDQPITLELAYPFQGQLTDDPREIPDITVNGQPVSAQMHPSADPAGMIDHAENWEEYRSAVTENDFLSEALAAAPEWDAPVTVYHFTGLAYAGASSGESIYLDVSWRSDPALTVWTYGAISIPSSEDGTEHRLLQIPTDPEAYWVPDEGYLIAVGGGLTDMAVSGNFGYEITEDSALDGVDYTLEQSESTFAEILWLLAGEYGNWPKYDHSEQTEFDTREILYEGAMKRILDGVRDVYSDDYHSIDGIFDRVLAEPRLLYWVFPAEIPAGGSVAVTVRFDQEGSSDGTGSGEATSGYDMAVRLGSSLHFTAVSASVTGWDQIRIVNQNFGFDPKNGITQVMLDTETERYFLDITEAN